METLPLLLKVIAMLSIVLVGPILGLMAISGVIKVFYDWLGQERADTVLIVGVLILIFVISPILVVADIMSWHRP